jgi:anti-sigma-K factor RskA
MSDPALTQEQHDLAAEYALGLLEGEELARARTMVRRDPEFRRTVGHWLGRYATLLDEVAPVQPPARVWAAVERQISSLKIANDNHRALRRQLRTWRAVAAGITAVAASLVVALITRQAPVAPPGVERSVAPPPLLALLGEGQNKAALIASWDPASRNLVVGAAETLTSDATHSHELWVIPADGKPRSLGTMPEGPRMYARLSEAVAGQLHEGATLAISLEPQGGSPTGSPTGPVIFSGKLESA